ncbi:hypothetical protein J5N97_020657 [Dioscorea zingiberensis]|uniref:PRONE domain-containing protein n=1 Tax=Dioscorea zingiberensis TaxID=325984 RepID=A0A9D5CHM3_9LILI|nr:hypothetical protein J5N97_020657 [Dioscorea zingiberensis]
MEAFTISVPKKKKTQPSANLMLTSDVEVMKEKFAKLLLGEDVSRGTRGISTALALSNTIISLLACVFGEMWKLELLSGTHKEATEQKDLMLAPGQANVGGCLLLKFPSLAYQILKAAKSINEQVLLQMPIPTAVKDTLPKSGKASLGEGLYNVISSEFYSIEEIVPSLISLKSEHSVLEIVNKLEGAIFSWKQMNTEESNKRSPIRHPFYFMRHTGLAALERGSWKIKNTVN